MKRFIIKILYLLFIPILVYVAIFFTCKSLFTNQLKKYPVIILGDSRTASYSFPNVFNRSVHGAPYFVHYEFVKEFANELKGKLVYISCNYLNFSKLYQNRLANDSIMINYAASMFQRMDDFYLINHLHSDIRPHFFKYSPVDFKPVTRLQNFDIFTYATEDNITDIADSAKIKEDIVRHWHDSRFILPDTIQRVYLNKMIKLLQKAGATVILLKMPTTNYYLENVPEFAKDELQQFATMQDVRLLDLNDSLKISHDYKYFYDYGHLNVVGIALVKDFLINKELIDSLGILE